MNDTFLSFTQWRWYLDAKIVQHVKSSARLNCFHGSHLCLSSSVRCRETQNYWSTHINMWENGPELKHDTICYLHMLNEDEIYISEMVTLVTDFSSTLAIPLWLKCPRKTLINIFPIIYHWIWRNIVQVQHNGWKLNHISALISNYSLNTISDLASLAPKWNDQCPKLNSNFQAHNENGPLIDIFPQWNLQSMQLPEVSTSHFSIIFSVFRCPDIGD